MSNLIKIDSIDSLTQICTILAESQLIKDAGDMSKLAVKVMAGQELGIPAMAAAMNINVIKGRVTMSANMIAQMIKSSGRYNYRIKTHNNSVCELVILEKCGDAFEEIGVSSFSMEDAKQAGLTSNPTWSKYPRNMLFARAISNAVRWHCPDVMMGNTVYTEEELESSNAPSFAVQQEPRAVEAVAPKETNGRTEWQDCVVKSKEGILEWGATVLGIDNNQIQKLMEAIPPDASGKKALVFIAAVREYWEMMADEGLKELTSADIIEEVIGDLKKDSEVIEVEVEAEVQS